jgi:NAD(P)-dependent dehydrogenase (short-subunit alcohol dehydrogenase family)
LIAGLPKFTEVERHDTYPFIAPGQFDLKDRTVFITGATGAIGRALAVAYTLAHASVLCIGARSSLAETVTAVEAAAKSANIPVPQLLLLKLDVTEPSSVAQAAITFRNTFPGGLDVLVNNAGYLEKVVPIGDSDPKNFIQSINVNLIGPYLMAHSFLPLLLASPQGLKTIVNISSIGSMLVLPGLAAYSASKLALVRFTDYLDAEYGEKGLSAFLIHPGGVPSAMSDSLPQQYREGGVTETPELAADTVVWLSAKRREWTRARFFNAQWDMEQTEERSSEIIEKNLLKVAFYG